MEEILSQIQADLLYAKAELSTIYLCHPIRCGTFLDSQIKGKEWETIQESLKGLFDSKRAFDKDHLNSA
jgi:hypothetical protein